MDDKMEQDTINDQIIKIGCYRSEHPYNIIADGTILHIYGGINRKTDLTHLKYLTEENFKELINKDGTIQELEILIVLREKKIYVLREPPLII